MLKQLNDERLGSFNGVYVDMIPGQSIDEAVSYMLTLIANNQVSLTENLVSKQTHYLANQNGKKVLTRGRFCSFV